MFDQAVGAANGTQKTEGNTVTSILLIQNKTACGRVVRFQVKNMSSFILSLLPSVAEFGMRRRGVVRFPSDACTSRSCHVSW